MFYKTKQATTLFPSESYKDDFNNELLKKVQDTFA